MISWFKPKIDRRREYPRLPEGTCIHVVGDVHGRTDLLDRLHAAMDADRVATGAETVEIYLGDYVDRGPDSAGVIERLIERRRRVPVVAIRGNHEVMFEAFLAGEVDPEEWRLVGGFETLLSYGLDVRALARASREKWVAAAAALVPDHHRDFLAELTDSHRTDGYFFTHAGIRPGIPLDEQIADDLQWVRDVFLGDDRDHGAVVVHGHTPTMEPEFLPNRINLDTGAYMTGRLTCLAIDTLGPRLIGTDPSARPTSDRHPSRERTR